LPLVLGRATRLAQFFTSAEKEYEATVLFGIETATYDSAGAIVAQSGSVPTREQVDAVLPRFRGAIEQVPPLYSAKMVDGDRAYKLARRAKDVRLAPVPVTVHALELITFEPPRATMRVVCSAGFYVRSLAFDLGKAVGTGATLDALRRTRSGEFKLDDAIPFGQVALGNRTALDRTIAMERLLLDWPSVALTPGGLTRALHGAELRPTDWVGEASVFGPSRMLAPDGRLVGLASWSQRSGALRPIAVFR
jgi:tRNA pseudouridine55 synthase